MTNIEKNNITSSLESFTLIDAEEGKVKESLLSQKDKRSNTKIHQPIGTITYTVGSSDTIERIALKCNTVPSDILHLNRLANRMIYPGQILYVPDPSYVPPPPPPTPPTQHHLTVQQTNQNIKNDDNHKTGSRSIFKPNESPKPGHIELIRRNTTANNNRSDSKSDLNDSKRANYHIRHTLSEDEAKKLDEECMQRFLKINSKIISYDKGIIDGVILITPTAVMFDPIAPAPHQNHEPSQEQSDHDDPNRQSSVSASISTEYDSVIIPIEVISNVVLYEDLSLRDIHNYFDQIRKEQHESSEQIAAALATDEQNKSSESMIKTDELSKNIEKFINESTSSEKINEDNDRTVIEMRKRSDKSSLSNSPTDKYESEHSKLERRNSIQIESLIIQNKETLLRQLSSSLTNLNTLKDEKKRTSTGSSESSASSLKSSQKNLLKEKEVKHGPKLNEALRRHSINNIPNLYDDLLCYLCIKVNTHKDFISCPMDRKMKNRLQSEFWFQVPDNSYKVTDKICAFFLAWQFDPTYALSPDTPRGKFQLVKDDNIDDTKASNKQNILKPSATFVKDWEVVNLYELELKMKVEKENENLSLPTLIGKSSILKDEHLRTLNCNLTARAISYNWLLTFSTEIHGFSLQTLYRTMIDVDSPCLIVVRDTNNNIFGAMTSCQIYQSDHFYGTGESFLYTFFPNFKIFKWTGENNFFIKGYADSLGIGCGDGIHGLWFDGDLYHGHSKKCKTYDNDILTSPEDFTIAGVEIWTFVD